MLDKSQLIQILKTGDAETLNALNNSDVGQSVSADEEVQVALACAADRVVFHRPNYREAVKQAVELGTPCDIWTAARAGLDDHVKRLFAEKPDLLNATDNVGRTSLQRDALIYGVCRECEGVADSLIADGAAVDVFTASTFYMPDIVYQ